MVNPEGISNLILELVCINPLVFCQEGSTNISWCENWSRGRFLKWLLTNSNRRIIHENLLYGLNTYRLEHVFFNDSTVSYSSDYSHTRGSKLVTTSKWLPKYPKKVRIIFPFSILIYKFINTRFNPDVIL